MKEFVIRQFLNAQLSFTPLQVLWIPPGNRLVVGGMTEEKKGRLAFI